MATIGGDGGVVMEKIPPWINRDVVVVPVIQHDLPKTPKKFLPKFNLEKKKILLKTTLAILCYLSTS